MTSIMFLNVSHNVAGAEVSLIELCRYLETDIAVACPKGSSLEKRLCSEDVQTVSLDIGVLKSGGLLAKLKNYSYARKVRKDLLGILSETKPDIFIANNLMADFFAGERPGELPVKTVCYCRDDPCEDIKAKFLSKRDLVIAPSQMITQSLDELGVTQYTHIPNGVDIDYFRNKPAKAEAREQLDFDQEKIIIGSAGQFIQRKGFDVFIKTAEILSKTHDDVRFVVSGGDLYEGSSYAEKIKEIVNVSAAKETLQLLGFQEDMRPFYAACDLYVTLSRNEPFGRTPIESALCGTLPLASNEGGHKEILGDFPDLLVDPDDPQAAAEKIREFIKDTEKRQHLLVDVQAKAEMFSAKTTAEKLRKALEELLKDREG
jgi:glycosyltransferase involved in cell wall biosynthesis